MKAKGKGTSEEVLSGDGQVVMTKWYDNKPVIMASTLYLLEMEVLVRDGTNKKKST